MIGPAALCSVDENLIERIRARRGLGRLAVSASLAVVVGAGLYGVVFGMWRGPTQSLHSSIKLPLILLVVACLTAGISAIFAALLRSKLSMAQTVVCVLLSLSVASVVLAAVAPVSAFLVLSAPPIDLCVRGLPREDARVAASLAVSRALLLWHVLVVACAGITGVMRLRHLLMRLITDVQIANRVLFAWMLAQLLVGSQVSWLLRPFLGEPQMPVLFLTDGALSGSFFEEIGRSMVMTFGRAASPLGVAAGLLLGWTLFRAMRARPAVVEIGLHAGGILVTQPTARTIPWSALSAAIVRGSEVVLHLALDVELTREELTVRCATAERARELLRSIDAARTQAGPFRTQPTTS